MVNASSRLVTLFLAGLFLSVALAGRPLPGQDVPPPAPRVIPPLPNRDGLLRIDVVVADQAGHPVTDLAPGDFTLLDNGKPTRIFTVGSSTGSGAGTEPPPELIFVFDEEALPPRHRELARQAVASYLRQDAGGLAQPVSLYRVAHEGLFCSARPSKDGNLLAQEAEKGAEPRLVWPAGGKSPGRSPINSSGPITFRTVGALGLIAIDQRNVAGRKTLVWFGASAEISAWRWCNFNEPAELSTRVREARITVNVVLANSGPELVAEAREIAAAAEKEDPRRPVMLTLPAIAAHTGGLVLHSWHKQNAGLVAQSPDEYTQNPGLVAPALESLGEHKQNEEIVVQSIDDLMIAIRRCAAESRAFYSLTFDPPRTEHYDEHHSLAVTVSRAGLRARTYSDYYNQPVYWDHLRPSLERLTVAQLEEVIRRQAADSGLPRRLGDMELTERLMPGRRAQLLALLHDDRGREALTALADISEFLPPPAGEALADPFPGREAVSDLLKRTVDYVADATHKLPDFFAARTAIAYQEPQIRDDSPCHPPAPEQPLRVAFTARSTVHYRNGDEVVEAEKTRHKKLLNQREHALDTHGIFGPVLAAVLAAATDRKSTLTWSRWERTEQGKLAVFRFLIPFSIFKITHCCLPEGDGTKVYHATPGYRGEFAVDPGSGAIMRMAIEADLREDRDPRSPLIRSAQLIEYGPVEIGGKRYICPQRSVSVVRGRTNVVMYDWGIPFIVFGPFETLVNDFTFSEYHKFGSESRILAGFEEAPAEADPNSKQSPGGPH